MDFQKVLGSTRATDNSSEKCTKTVLIRATGNKNEDLLKQENPNHTLDQLL